MASSISQIDKPQSGCSKRAELLDVNINTGAQSINTERTSLSSLASSSFKTQTCDGRFQPRRISWRSPKLEPLPVGTGHFCCTNTVGLFNRTHKKFWIPWHLCNSPLRLQFNAFLRTIIIAKSWICSLFLHSSQRWWFIWRREQWRGRGHRRRVCVPSSLFGRLTYKLIAL